MKKDVWADLKEGKLLSMIREPARGQKIDGVLEFANIIKPLTAEKPDLEQFWAFFLDAKRHIMAIERLFTGSICSANIYPREVIKAAFHHQAMAMLFAHNHPSGDPKPSKEDHIITKQLLFACEGVGMQVLEHLIVGDCGRFFSFAETGLIEMYKKDYVMFISTHLGNGGN